MNHTCHIVTYLTKEAEVKRFIAQLPVTARVGQGQGSQVSHMGVRGPSIGTVTASSKVLCWQEDGNGIHNQSWVLGTLAPDPGTLFAGLNATPTVHLMSPSLLSFATFFYFW